MQHFIDNDQENDGVWKNRKYRPPMPIWKVSLITIALALIILTLLFNCSGPASAREIPVWNTVDEKTCVSPAVTRIVALVTFDKETLRGRLMIKRIDHNNIIVRREYFKVGKPFKFVAEWRQQGRCLHRWRTEPVEIT